MAKPTRTIQPGKAEPKEEGQDAREGWVQLDLPPRAMARLDRLKAKTEASTYQEVLQNALRLYEGLIEEDESGSQFLSRDKNGVISPFRLFL